MRESVCHIRFFFIQNQVSTIKSTEPILGKDKNEDAVIYTSIWAVLSFCFFFALTKRNASRKKLSLALYPLPSTHGLGLRIAQWGSFLCLFCFCGLWTSSVLELAFPSFSSHSWLLSLSSTRLSPKFSYSATLFIIDKSSSMNASFNPTMSRLSTAKQCIKGIIQKIDTQGNGKDAFGLMEMARIAPIVVPLTRNRSFFFQKLQQVAIEEDSRLNGTGLGYALFKGEYLLVALAEYAKKNHVETLSQRAKTIVVVTDGLEEPNPADKNQPFRFMHVKESLLQAQALGVFVWYVIVNPSFSTSSDITAAYAKNQLIQLAKQTGGGYVEIASSGAQLEAVNRIAQAILERKEESVPRLNYPLLLSLQLGLMLTCLGGMRFFEFLGYRIG